MKPDRKAVIGLIQMSCTDDLAENLQKCVAHIEEAAKMGAHIVSTQELFRSTYFCQTTQHDNFALAESIPGGTTKVLSKVARERHLVIIASLFEEGAPGLFHNTAVVIDADGKLLGMYRKMHIPDAGRLHEGFYFTPGDLGFKAFKTKYGKLGVLLGWDQWSPEAARITALAGAEILFVPTAIGWSPPEKEVEGEAQHSAWAAMLRSHAIANGIYVAVTNRVGYEALPALHYAPAFRGGTGVEFWGQTFVADPIGRVLSKASATEEQVLMTECDFSKNVVQRTHWPYLRDRRIDSYGDIGKRVID
jgi:N-carbamoylputrescine amidase